MAFQTEHTEEEETRLCLDLFHHYPRKLGPRPNAVQEGHRLKRRQRMFVTMTPEADEGEWLED